MTSYVILHILTLFTTLLLAFLLVSCARLLWVLPGFRPQGRPERRPSARLLVVLGSGGHTAEMLRLVESLDFKKYVHRTYVISSGDSLSEGKARDLESRNQEGKENKVLSYGWFMLIEGIRD